MQRARLFIGIAALSAACGDSTGGTGGSGGGAVGSSSTNSASSSGTLSLPADGAYFLDFTNDDPLACGFASNSVAVGEVDASNRTKVITDGMGGAKVRCETLGATSFAVHAELNDPSSATYFNIIIPGITPAASESASAGGTLRFSAAWTAGNLFTGACSFYFTAGTPETVAPGKVWLTFDCPAMIYDMETCGPVTGYAVFENCATQ